MLYKICGKVTISCWTEVEADSLDDALEEANFRDLAEIHIDGTYTPDDFWIIDTDGVPFDLREDSE